MVEPTGVLHGALARAAVKAGFAAPLQGGDSAFALCRLIGETPSRIVPVDAVPDAWRDALATVCAPPPDAGLPPGPLVMGILNATPDSFSDGGVYPHPEDAVTTGLAMIAAGADILDIGGESTRPGASFVEPAREQDRILPILAGLRGHGALISVDTRNASTMRAALAGGADLINDVSALSHDPAAAGLLAAATCPVVLMHMRGTPATMAGLARYDDVASEVVAELAARVAHAVAAGIARTRIIVDPGIGFAKNAGHNFELLRRLPLLANLGCRLLLGASRKAFIGQAGGVPVPAARDPGSIAANLVGLALPGCVLRVHDVPGMVQALRVWQAIHGGGTVTSRGGDAG